MPLLLLRVIFLVVTAGVGIFIVRTGSISGDIDLNLKSFFILLILAFAVIGLDMAFPKKKVALISAIYFGLLIGLVMTFFFATALEPYFVNDETGALRRSVLTVMLIFFSYFGVSFLLQTQNDFRFIIPFVEFQPDVKGVKPFVLDTSVVIDGRIADIMETKILDVPLVIPRFAILELQRVADSSDRNRRTRGRRGLDILSRLQNMEGVDLRIDESELPEYQKQPVDLKLVALAKHLEGRLVTNDFNLNKVAKIQGVTVINLNDLANALKPVFLPGEKIVVDIIKGGEEPGQGVAYLDDGTMVVVEQGRDYITERVVVTVTSVLQTSAGRMIFSRYEEHAQKKTGTPAVLDDIKADSGCDSV